MQDAVPDTWFDRAHGEAPGGRWFYLQKQVHECHRVMGRGVIIAWGKSAGGKGGFTFGWYPNAGEVLTALLELDADKRFAFEQIPHDTPCRPYADVEWEGVRDETHALMRRMCSALRGYCARVFPGKCMQLYVSCSTRPGKGGVWKNSYHLHIRNVVFASNHNGQMRRFWEAFAREELAEGMWYWTKTTAARPEARRAHVIDMSVYTKNRNLRLPWCMKRGGTPFVRVSGDPAAPGDDMTARFSATNTEAWLPFWVGNAKPEENDVLVAAVRRAEAPKRAAKRAADQDADGAGPGSGKMPRAGGSEHERLLGMLPHAAREVLVRGSTCLSVKPVDSLPYSLRLQLKSGALRPEDITHMYVLNPRRCVTQWYMQGVDHSHDGNNSICVVAPAVPGEFPGTQVFVKCHCAEKKTARARLATENRFGELPDYDKSMAKKIVETPHGIDGVVDSKNRQIVKRIYKMKTGARRYELQDDKNKAAWHSVLACDENWHCVPEPLPGPAKQARHAARDTPARPEC